MKRRDAGPQTKAGEDVKERIEDWRRTRTKRSPMPEALWRRAVELAREEGVYGAARLLGLNYGTLRARAERAGVPTRRRERRASAPSRPAFVELRAGSPEPPPACETIVEMTSSAGQKLTVRVRGGELDVAALIRQCWQRRG